MFVLIGRLLTGCIGLMFPAMRVPDGTSLDGSSADKDRRLSSCNQIFGRLLWRHPHTPTHVYIQTRMQDIELGELTKLTNEFMWPSLQIGRTRMRFKRFIHIVQQSINFIA